MVHYRVIRDIMRDRLSRIQTNHHVGTEFVVPMVFDAAWYLSENPDVVADGVDPALHFSRHGAREGRSPSPLFDAKLYREINIGVATEELSVTEHYWTYGITEQRHPSAYFDPVFYSASHKHDIAAKSDPLTHYVRNARRPGHHPHPLFDNDWYAEQYLKHQPNVVPLAHFITIGEAQGLRPNPLFDPKYYCDKYLDGAKFSFPFKQYVMYGISNKQSPNPYFDPTYYLLSRKQDIKAVANPLAHYIAHARLPGHHPNPFFDNDWYIDEYLTNDPYITPLEHFLQTGESKWINPHPLFDQNSYLKLNNELGPLIERGDFGSPYEHFVKWGAHEVEKGGRRQFGFVWGQHWLDFDRIAYVQDNPDVEQRIKEGRCRTALEHIFMIGWREALDGMRSIYSDRHTVKVKRQIDNGAITKRGRHLCIFAHYDRDDVIDPYVIIYLKSLRKFDVDIVFVTATQRNDEINKITDLVTKLIIKNEAGRDFGSWYLALTIMGLDCGEGYERVIFANDSIYFPVRPANALFEDMIIKKFNVYGLSDSMELGQYHLQSFFIAFDRKAQRAIFPNFLSNFKRNYLLTKWGQIREYELGITEYAQRAKLSVGAFFSGADAREDVIRDPRLSRWSAMRGGIGHINPTHDLWDLIIGVYGWPGLKLELLRDNPKNVAGLNTLPQLISDGEVPFEVLNNHLNRSKKQSVIVRPVEDIPNRPTPVKLISRISGRHNKPAKRLVLFAHYDPQGVIDPHIVYQVRSLMEAGCAICFITSTQDAIQIEMIAPFVRDVLVKSEAGRDFGSWELALRVLGNEIDDFDYVIWMNDSTYFPLHNPAPMFEEMEGRSVDFWGIVDSNNIDWHVMSWFWAFGRKAASQWFEWYLDEFDVGYRKWDQIRNYEVRLPRLIRESGLKVDVYIPCSDVRNYILERIEGHPGYDSAQRGDFTMTHTFWRETITHFRCPALKVELVRDNPLLLDLSDLLKVIGDHTLYDPNLIRSHIARLKTAHLPSPVMANVPSLR